VQWTLHLLARNFSEKEEVSVSYELVRRTLKNRLSPHLKQQWCIPPEQNANFVWHMGDVLEFCTRPDDSPLSAGVLQRAPSSALCRHPGAEAGTTRCSRQGELRV
jgi:hypothetical protein